MTTCRVPNRYIRRADLIRLLDGLWPRQCIIEVRLRICCTVTSDSSAKIDRQEHSDAWIVSGISRELTKVGSRRPARSIYARYSNRETNLSKGDD